MARLPAEVVRLLELAVGHPEGEAALFEGHLESVAALYQVHPQTVDRLRSCLEQPDGRVQAEEVLERARLHCGLSRRASAPRRSLSPWAVISRARAFPGGVELLTRAPSETAAVVLGTHPFVIDEVRRQLEVLAADPEGAQSDPLAALQAQLPPAP